MSSSSPFQALALSFAGENIKELAPSAEDCSVGSGASPSGTRASVRRAEGRSLADVLLRSWLAPFAAFAAMAVVLTLTFGLAALVVLPRQQETLDAQTALRQMHVGMLDQETGLRAFLVTAQGAALEPYDDGRAAVDSALDDLDTLTDGDAALRGAVAEVRSAQQRWSEGWARQARDPAAGSVTPARLDDFIARGKALFDDYRVVEARLEGLLQRRIDASTTVNRQVLLVGGVLALVGSLVYPLLAYRGYSRLRTTVSEPAGRLVAAMRRLEAGEREVDIPAAGAREMRQLATGLSAMSRAVDEENAALRRGEHRFREVFTAAPVGMVVSDEGGRIEQANEVFGQLVGRTADDLSGMRLAEVAAPADVDALTRARVRVLSEGGREPVELRLRSTLEEQRWCRLTLAGVRSADDELRLFVHAEDITERRAAVEELRAAYEATQQANTGLQELEQTKSDFLGSVSHELRTPLTSIMGYLEMLRDGTLAPLNSDQHDVMAIVERNAQRLYELIEDLLLLSRVEGGALRADVAEIDLGDVVNSVFESLRPTLAGRRLDVSVHVPPRAAAVRADAAQLERVLLNLLTNAVKFTEDGGRIAVVAARRSDDVQVSVTDSGMGIPVEEQQHLFERFFRSSSAYARAVPGTGLGLAIVKSIVDAHGGALTVDSTPGVGTTVSFTLAAAVDADSQSSFAALAS